MMSVQTFLVLTYVVLTAADTAYENKLTKLWSLSSASNSDGSVNVTSTSIVIQPSVYNREARTNSKYAFKPRAIPLIREQSAENAYYSQDVNYKPKMLFSGNYMPIAKEKGNKNLTEPNERESFHPRAIPLIRSQEFQRRSLDVDEEPTIEKPEGFTEQTASRRSISYMLGLDEEDPEEEEEEEEDGEIEEGKGKKKVKKPKLKLKAGKLKKYVVPLLMAYKMKYFALVPVLIGGLILLVGATGLAGFFFALFAAVMGLQKGGY
ncbi:uncharacterized protein LOC128680605 [Plodia interpunctella]|uniref:uncharacterized protein LOC128680605 n=1 Tax=Plodia interpunctella TaxID=58824 RepID=UPI00236870BE|nr:uncharacterized protein LOC128680605 [Plodia interpunctella]